MENCDSKGKKNQNFEKHACENTVFMETSNCLDQQISYQVVVRQILGKVTKFGGVCFNIKKVINVQSQHGNFLPSHHTPRPVSGLFQGKLTMIDSLGRNTLAKYAARKVSWTTCL